MLEQHINKTFTYPEDIAPICRTFVIVKPVQPKNLEEEEYKDMGKEMMWEMAMKNYMKQLDLLASNTQAVWGQCSAMMQSKLESLDDYESKS